MRCGSGRRRWPAPDSEIVDSGGSDRSCAGPPSLFPFDLLYSRSRRRGGPGHAARGARRPDRVLPGPLRGDAAHGLSAAQRGVHHSGDAGVGGGHLCPGLRPGAEHGGDGHHHEPVVHRHSGELHHSVSGWRERAADDERGDDQLLHELLAAGYLRGPGGPELCHRRAGRGRLRRRRLASGAWCGVSAVSAALRQRAGGLFWFWSVGAFRRSLPVLFLAGLAAFILGPLLSVILWAFAGRWFYPALLPQEFSLKWWDVVFGNRSVVSSIKYSLMTAPTVTLLSALICLPAAYAFARFQFPGRRFLLLSFLIAI